MALCTQKYIAIRVFQGRGYLSVLGIKTVLDNKTTQHRIRTLRYLMLAHPLSELQINIHPPSLFQFVIMLTLFLSLVCRSLWKIRSTGMKRIYKRSWILLKVRIVEHF